jgi:hypothetical protein
MVPYDLIHDWQQLALSAIVTPDSGLLTSSSYPLIPTCWLVTFLPGRQTFEPSSIYIFTSSEQTAEKGDLCFLRRPIGDRSVQPCARRSRIAFGKRTPFQPQPTYLADEFISAGVDLGEFFLCRRDQSIDVYEISHNKLFGLNGKEAR